MMSENGPILGVRGLFRGDDVMNKRAVHDLSATGLYAAFNL